MLFGEAGLWVGRLTTLPRSLHWAFALGFCTGLSVWAFGLVSQLKMPSFDVALSPIWG